MRCHGEALIPEQLQRLDGLLLFRPPSILVIEDGSGFLVRHDQLPEVLRFVVQFLFLHFIIHFPVLKGDHAQTDIIRLLDNCVQDRAELLLLRELWTFSLPLRIVVLDLTLELPPGLIAFVHHRQQLQLVYDPPDRFFSLGWQVAILLLTLGCFQLYYQRLHQQLHLRTVTDTILHLPGQFFHLPAALPHQFISGCGLLLIGVEHLLLENIVGENKLDFLDSLS